jgi:hypothetical protein
MPDLDDLPALRAIAEKATRNWSYAEWQSSQPEPGQEEAWLHIATFHPALVLRLLDEIDRLNKGFVKLLEENVVRGREIDRLSEARHQPLPYLTPDEINWLVAENTTMRSRIEELEKAMDVAAEELEK